MALAWNLAKVSTRGLIARGALTETAVPEDAWDVAEQETAEFKDRLAEWAATSGPSGVVVCVDELDRCRTPCRYWR